MVFCIKKNRGARHMYAIDVPFFGLIEETGHRVSIADTGIEAEMDMLDKIKRIYVHASQGRFLEDVSNAGTEPEIDGLRGMYFSHQPVQSSLDFNGLRFLFRQRGHRDLIGIEYLDQDKYWQGVRDEQEWLALQSRLQVRHEFHEDDFNIGYVSVPVLDDFPLRDKRLSYLSCGYDCPATTEIDAAGRVRWICLYDRPETEAVRKWADNEEAFVLKLSPEETREQFGHIDGTLTVLFDSSARPTHHIDVHGLRLLYDSRYYDGELVGFIGYQYLEPERYGFGREIE